MSISASGQVSKSGNERDDLMGMTGEAGTESLVSSGHPGPGSSFKNPVGLIASSDGGSNWQSISLEGEVDYHALAVSEGTVIGYGGGKTLSVSADGGRTWSPGAAIQPAALALSSQRVLATTQAGLQVSTDTGQSFEVVAGAPRLVLISAGTGTTCSDSMTIGTRGQATTQERVGRASAQSATLLPSLHSMNPLATPSTRRPSTSSSEHTCRHGFQ